MATLNSDKTECSLIKKGFTKLKGKQDHIRLEFWYDGKLTRINTKLSHNGQDIDDFLISHMSKQVCLSKSDFIDLIKCPLSKEQYIDKLLDKGFIGKGESSKSKQTDDLSKVKVKLNGSSELFKKQKHKSK